ncbi:MAG: ion transporter [Hyphomonadaceae bacterium]
MASLANPAPETKLQGFVSSRVFRFTIIFLIFINAVILGALTFMAPDTHWYDVLLTLDNGILFIFVCEMVIKLIAWRSKFFRNGWNIFDVIVIGICMVPATGAFAVLRSMRVLRVLRLLHFVPMLRRITEALFRALPGMTAIIAVMVLMIYVGAVIATNLFGNTDNPDVLALFGNLYSSALSLFQVMTMDGWRFEVMQKVIDDGHPYAWVFFLVFIFLASFAILNLFIAVFVEALQAEHDSVQDDKIDELEDIAEDGVVVRSQILKSLEDLQTEMAKMRAELEAARIGVPAAKEDE